MATASQKMMEIRFFVLIRGALTPAPTMLTPVVKMPLKWEIRDCYENYVIVFYPAAPTTDRATDNPIPIKAHI